MKKTLKHIIAGFTLVVLVFFAFPATTSANTDESSDQTAQHADATYVFEVQSGQSLSRLTRKAIQEYDESNISVSLNKAQAIYAETQIVNELGARLLEVGETIEIKQSLVDKYAKLSQELSDSKIAAWQYYANQANFNVDDIAVVSEQADTQPGDSTAEEEQASNQTGTMSTNTDETGQDSEETEAVATNDTKPEGQQDEHRETTTASATDDDGLAWYWWVITIVALALIYYVFTGDGKPKTDSKPKRKSRSSSTKKPKK